MSSVSYPVIRDSATQKLKIHRPRGRMASGLYGYQWTVTDNTGAKKVLCGISESLSQRLSSYISEFNKPLNDQSSKLAQLVNDPDRHSEVRIFGPYGKETDPKELEQKMIRKIPKKERLNQTSGGNGGGSWSQYDDLSPSKGIVKKNDTPKKYYSLVDRGTHIAPLFSPKIRKGKKEAVYKVKHVKTGDTYVGMSTDVVSRIRKHASDASHHPEKSKVAKAIQKSPESHVFGILSSTEDYTPRTLRKAEKHYIEAQEPKYNANRGGGGPTKMRKKKKLDFSKV